MVTAGLALDTVCGSSRSIPRDSIYIDYILYSIPQSRDSPRLEKIQVISAATPKVADIPTWMPRRMVRSRDLPRLEKIQVHTPATPKVADPTWKPRKLKYEWFGSVSSGPDFLGDVPMSRF